MTVSFHSEGPQTVQENIIADTISGGHVAVHQQIVYGQPLEPSVWYEQAISGLDDLLKEGEITSAEKDLIKGDIKAYEKNFKEYETAHEAGDSAKKRSYQEKLYGFIKKLPSQPWRVTKILQAGMPIPPPFANALAFAVEAGKEFESQEAADEIEARFRAHEEKLAKLIQMSESGATP